MNTREQSHLNRAIRIARESTCRQKHGVVIAKGPRVLAVAVNEDRNNPNNCTNPKLEASYHAEFKALMQTINANDATLYSARVNNRGEPLYAKPCASCQKIIERAGIRKVIHT
jgi:deoxycytidylate deaminase